MIVEVEFLKSVRLNNTLYHPAVQLLNDDNTVRETVPAERAGFDEETAKELVDRGLARIVRVDVPMTAGIEPGRADVLCACPHCGKDVKMLGHA